VAARAAAVQAAGPLHPGRCAGARPWAGGRIVPAVRVRAARSAGRLPGGHRPL